MARISVERAHGLGKEAAREKADKLAQKLSEQYGLEPQWSGDTLNLRRPGVKGAVHVGDDSIKVDVELGLLMSAMSGTIKSEIERALPQVRRRTYLFMSLVRVPFLIILTTLCLSPTLCGQFLDPSAREVHHGQSYFEEKSRR